MKPIFAAVVLFVLPFGVSAQEFAQHLPKSGIIRGSVMVAAAAPELEALAKRMQTAVAANAEWFRAYVEAAGTGELPYHTNLGLTEEEYKRFLSRSEAGSTLRHVGSVEISLNRAEDGTLTFVSTPSDFPLHLVSISADGTTVETPYGRLMRGADINQRDANAPTGRWSGPRWENEDVSGSVSWAVQLAIGTREDFNDGIIYYNVIRQGGAAPERVQFALLYPLQ
jgi:hypothetical protein